MKEIASARILAVRGGAPQKRRSVRTLAAFGENPGCGMATLAFAAEVDLDAYLSGTTLAMPFGQSPFAIKRGLQFEAGLKKNKYEKLRELLAAEVGFQKHGKAVDLRAEHKKNKEGLVSRAAATRDEIAKHVKKKGDATHLIDGGVLTATVLGQTWFFEADAIAAVAEAKLRVGEMKSFPVVDGRTEEDKFGAALDQAAVYLLLLEDMVAQLSGDPAELVSRDAMIITPKNTGFTATVSIHPARSRIDRSRRLLAKAPSALDVISEVDPAASFDPRPLADRAMSASGAGAAWAGIPPEKRLRQLDLLRKQVGAAYDPRCLSSCGLARYCRADAVSREDPCLLGSGSSRALPGVESLSRVLELSAGKKPNDAERAAAEALALAGRMLTMGKKIAAEQGLPQTLEETQE